MQIGELSSRTGVSARMLRFYEKYGLLNPARTSSGYRQYTLEDLEMVTRIILLNGAGLPLSTIVNLLGCVRFGASPVPPCEALKTKIQAQLKRVDHQVEMLNKSRKLLVDLLH